jgi:peptidoglycan/xylan/chitin deacetylase (PgdA/CDA1 family)
LKTLFGGKTMHKYTRFGFMVGVFIIGVGIGLLAIKISGGSLMGLTPVPKPKVSDGPEYSRRQPVSLDLVKLFPYLITRQGNPKQTALALSFDDGPDLKYTPKILDILKKYKVKATFFVVGALVQKYPATFHRIIREGHAVGNHGYQHLKICELTPDKARYQLTKNQEIITKNGGPRQLIFRPPYGALDPASINLINKQGYQIILWTIDSFDWRGLKKQQVITNVVPHINHGYIVLQHSASESKLEDLTGSIEALPEIIKSAKSRGYRFITIPELLREDSQKSKVESRKSK